MAKPLIVVIPHQLGRAEARRRLETGIGQLKNTFGGQYTSVEESWTDDRLDFRVAAVGQTVTGMLDVADESVRVELQLPWMLALIAQKAQAFLRREGTLLLEKKQ